MSVSSLEPVSAGQTRFRLAGLAVDARGIAVGREVLVVVGTFDQAVRFLGAASQETPLDEILPTLQLERARRRTQGSPVLLLRWAAGDGYALDTIQRLATAVGGASYTGAHGVYVRLRDREAPFGYDVAEAISTAGDGVVVCDREGRVDYERVPGSALDPVEMVLSLRLRRCPVPRAGLSLDPALASLGELALVLVAPGLADAMLQYLWRRQVDFAGLRFVLGEDTRPSLLLRLRHAEPRLLDVLHEMAGVDLLVPVSSRAAVEVGYAHPLHLPAMTGALPGDDMFLFRGRAGRVERLPRAPRFVEGRYLVEQDRQAEPLKVLPARENPMEPIRVALKLRSTPRLREPRATLVAFEQLPLLCRLAYLLPPLLLASSRVLLIAEGMIVVCGPKAQGGTVLPLGRRLCELAAGVYVPDGYEFWPRVRPSLVRDVLGLDAEELAFVLSPSADPVKVRAGQLVPLDVALLRRIVAYEADLREPTLSAVTPGALHHDRLGRFALWGFPDTVGRTPLAAMPAAASEEHPGLGAGPTSDLDDPAASHREP